jgi:hypothetical protein
MMDDLPSSTTEKKTDEKLERAVRCARCGHGLTSEKQKIDVGGRHGHTFMNPSGVIFHIVCYREVPGAVVEGLPEKATSWFPSTAWQYAHCGSCRGQIGWAYVNLEDGERFFGLIEDSIVL